MSLKSADTHLHSPAPNHDLLSKSGGVRQVQVSTGSIGQSVRCLYEPPLDMFGADAVERWLTERESSDIVELVYKLKI